LSTDLIFGFVKFEFCKYLKGIELFAESAHEDLYAAVDELVDKWTGRWFATKIVCNRTIMMPPSA